MFSVILQILLPHHLLSRLILHFLRIRWRWLKNLQIRFVIQRFEINMSQAENPDIESYEHFNAFFTRAIKATARPVANPTDTKSFCSPVDGTISQHGPITGDQLLQAKGIGYALPELIGGKTDIAKPFTHGYFATIYLSPRDYHRIHMPANGKLLSMTYIPGRLFSVADKMVQSLPGLFNRNERIVCVFETDNGPIAVILVGAIFVGCMETVWHGTVTPPRRSSIHHISYNDDTAPALSKGQEMGRFNMGSTVIVLWSHKGVCWYKNCAPGSPVDMGQEIAIIQSE